MIMMDTSSSIGSEYFRDQKNFVVKMIRGFEDVSSQSRFGIIAYNTEPKVIVKFSSKKDQNPSSLANIVYGKQ